MSSVHVESQHPGHVHFPNHDSSDRGRELAFYRREYVKPFIIEKYYTSYYKVCTIATYDLVTQTIMQGICSHGIDLFSRNIAVSASETFKLKGSNFNIYTNVFCVPIAQKHTQCDTCIGSICHIIPYTCIMFARKYQINTYLFLM